MESLTLGKGSRSFRDNAFVTGILSLMDTLLGVPMKEILTVIPLDEEVQQALLEKQGALGMLLDLVSRLEEGDQDSLESGLKAYGLLSMDDITQAQVSALAWANSIAPG